MAFSPNPSKKINMEHAPVIYIIVQGTIIHRQSKYPPGSFTDACVGCSPRGDQIDVFKILNGYENIYRNMLFSLKKDNRTRGHEETLVQDQCRLDIRNTLTDEWNKLSILYCVNASSVNMLLLLLLLLNQKTRRNISTGSVYIGYQEVLVLTDEWNKLSIDYVNIFKTTLTRVNFGNLVLLKTTKHPSLFTRVQQHDCFNCRMTHYIYHSSETGSSSWK